MGNPTDMDQLETNPSTSAPISTSIPTTNEIILPESVPVDSVTSDSQPIKEIPQTQPEQVNLAPLNQFYSPSEQDPMSQTTETNESLQSSELAVNLVESNSPESIENNSETHKLSQMESQHEETFTVDQENIDATNTPVSVPITTDPIEESQQIESSPPVINNQIESFEESGCQEARVSELISIESISDPTKQAEMPPKPSTPENTEIDQNSSGIEQNQDIVKEVNDNKPLEIDELTQNEQTESNEISNATKELTIKEEINESSDHNTNNKPEEIINASIDDGESQLVCTSRENSTLMVVNPTDDGDGSGVDLPEANNNSNQTLTNDPVFFADENNSNSIDTAENIILDDSSMIMCDVSLFMNF